MFFLLLNSKNIIFNKLTSLDISDERLDLTIWSFNFRFFFSSEVVIQSKVSGQILSGLASGFLPPFVVKDILFEKGSYRQI